ncbi:12055_t:CDS:2 [Gigaspora margarita]|uniref:12055_t:CDS:1 n=1 Tax=Gigaspora margarita TaxID=4874 RepID=A0ABN7ULJ9_GIGMA|nr:12055_t:CDS:2 [Gigaspora margarita]
MQSELDLLKTHIAELEPENAKLRQIIKEKSDFETENFKHKAKNAKLKAEVAKLRHDIEEIKLQTRVNTNEQNTSLIDDISQLLAYLESLVTLEAQRSTRGTSSNSLFIEDHSNKDYSINVNASQLKAKPASLKDKKIDEFLDSKYKEKVSKEIIQSIKKKKLQEQDLSLVNQVKSEKMIPQSCDVKTVTKCYDQNYVLDNSDTISIKISESINQIIEGLIQEMACNQTQSIVSPEINSISSNKFCIQDMIPGSVASKTVTKCHDQNNSEVSESTYPDNLLKAEISAKSSSEAQNASLNSCLPISILPDDPKEK